MKRTIIFILTTMLSVWVSYADTKATIYTKGGKAIEVIICPDAYKALDGKKLTRIFERFKCHVRREVGKLPKGQLK